MEWCVRKVWAEAEAEKGLDEAAFYTRVVFLSPVGPGGESMVPAY